MGGGRNPDGRVAYRVKYPGRGSTHRLMTPLEFLARLAALVAPPRYPLLRYHGILAPHATWRHRVVPKSPKGDAHRHPCPRPAKLPRARQGASPRSAHPSSVMLGTGTRSPHVAVFVVDETSRRLLDALEEQALNSPLKRLVNLARR